LIESLRWLGDGTLRDRATNELTQPSSRMTMSMTQDPGLGQDQSIASASEAIILENYQEQSPHNWS